MGYVVGIQNLFQQIGKYHTCRIKPDISYKTSKNSDKLNKQKHPTIILDGRKRKKLTEDPKTQIIQRINRDFLDILILRLILAEPMWGYKIIKKTEKLFGIKLRHGALYPLLNSLEENSYIKNEKIAKGGRIRKVYTITQKGMQLVDTYYNCLRDQLKKMDIEEG
jgi:PadR family transcriptional regulator PadR